jgi:hypothetical protein
MPPTTATDVETPIPVTLSSPPTSTPPRSGYFMLRPGQPGALSFNEVNVSEFLRRWNIECEDAGLTGPQKCQRVGDYCSPEVKEVVELLPGYDEKDWAVLEKELKNMYWQYDEERDTMATLNKLVKNAPNLKLNVFLLKYTAMSDILVKKNALSPLDRVGYLLDGLSVELRRKVLEFCAKKSWRLSTHDSGTTDPNYDQLKEFVLQKAVAAQKEVVYSGERSTRQESSIPTASVAVEIKANVPTLTSTPDLTPEMTPKTTPATSNDIAELTKQFSQLALAIQAGLRSTGTPAMPTASVQPAVQPAFQPGRPPFDPNRPRRCMWCDSTEHGKW